MKKILVPCDFSNPAVQAFGFACQLAAVNKAEVYVLNVIELPAIHHPLAPSVNAYEDSFIKELKSKVNKNFDKINSIWENTVKTRLYVEHGLVNSSIRKFVDKHKIDLIVIGTHGASGIWEYAIGSNAEKVVQTSKVPVIAIKKAPPAASIKNIVFPTNLDLSKTNLITSVQELQKLFKAKLHLLYVNTPGRFARSLAIEQRMKEFVKHFQLKNVTLNIFNDIDEEEGIINFSSRFKNKIIAMSTHGRRGLNHLFSGSIAEDVVNHIECPIWTSTE